MWKKDLSNILEQEPAPITEADLQEKVSGMRTWTGPGTGMIYTYWLKKLTSHHEPLVTQMNQC